MIYLYYLCQELRLYEKYISLLFDYELDLAHYDTLEISIIIYCKDQKIDIEN